MRFEDGVQIFEPDRRRKFDTNDFTEHIIRSFMYYVYIIRNSKSKDTYIGYTNDLERRMKEHKEKHSELIYYEAYRDERDARERERKLKQRGQTIRRLKERLFYSLS